MQCALLLNLFFLKYGKIHIHVDIIEVMLEKRKKKKSTDCEIVWLFRDPGLNTDVYIMSV